MVSSSYMVNDVPKLCVENKYQKYHTVVYIDWSLSGSGYWIKHPRYHIYNDFKMMISRSTTTIGGYYHYDLWFYSESYYWDGRKATYTSTNVKNINVYVDGVLKKQNNSAIGITFFDEMSPHSLRVVSKSKNPLIYVTWGQIKAI